MDKSSDSIVRSWFDTGIQVQNLEQREANMSVLLVPGLGRNLLSSSAALANGVETTIYSFPRNLAKGEAFT